VVFTDGAVEVCGNHSIGIYKSYHAVLQLKLKYTSNLNTLEVLLIAAYNLSCSTSTKINPVVKMALLLSDR